MTVEDTIERVAREICKMQKVDPRSWCGRIGDRRTSLEEARDDASLIIDLLRPGDNLGNGLRAEQDWQPIETAPKDGTTILLSNGGRVERGWWSTSVWLNKPGWATEDECEYWITFDDATHWRSLPAPPVTKQESEAE